MHEGEFDAFFQESGWNVVNPQRVERRSPEIDVKVDFCDTVVVSLAKKGYWSSNPQLIWDAPTDMVIDMFNYEAFVSDYQETEMMMNEVNND